MILGIKGQPGQRPDNPQHSCVGGEVVAGRSWAYLGSNLVATLAGLKVDNFSHLLLVVSLVGVE